MFCNLARSNVGHIVPVMEAAIPRDRLRNRTLKRPMGPTSGRSARNARMGIWNETVGRPVAAADAIAGASSDQRDIGAFSHELAMAIGSCRELGDCLAQSVWFLPPLAGWPFGSPEWGRQASVRAHRKNGEHMYRLSLSDRLQLINRRPTQSALLADPILRIESSDRLKATGTAFEAL
jgi:hypothetical protein